MKFEAIALSDQFNNGRKSGVLEIVHHNLAFIDDDGKVYGFPLNGVKITKGGAAGRYIYFNHEKFPGLTIYTDDKDILDIEEIRLNPALNAQTKNMRHTNKMVWFILITLFSLIVTGVIALFVFRGSIVERIATLIPPETEQQIAKDLKTSAIAGKQVVKDSAIEAQLHQLTEGLVKAVGDTSFKFNFTIIKDDAINAFALPGGSVIIHSGLIEKAQSPEEVAGVLAHEISHVTRRHHIRGIIGNMGIWLVIRGIIGDVSGISSDIINAGAALGTLKYTRDFEREADQSGFDLLNKAQINPQGMIDFFGTLKKENGDMGVADFLSTHPATEERIDNLKKMKVENKTFKAFDLDFKIFQERIQTYFNTNK
ncbi:MAG: M48 family metallopeptidase [Bacteroidetes bacterium]|nr:M48 family metallopeptidase [Bacteroidota bacterium]